MQEPKQRGGARPGSGRKPKYTKKAPLTVYLDIKEMDLLGGREEVRSLIYDWWKGLTGKSE